LPKAPPVPEGTCGEGDGYISPQNQIVITFNLNHSSLAYSLKKVIGYGNIYKIKNKNALKLVISKNIRSPDTGSRV
jgi:hypothetical protein